MSSTPLGVYAFAAPVALPLTSTCKTRVCQRTIPTARKGGGKKRAKNTGSKGAKPQSKAPSSKVQRAKNEQTTPEVRETSEPSSFPGPLAPDILFSSNADTVAEQKTEAVADDIILPDESISDDLSQLPVASEARIKLPDLGPVGTKGAKRRKKPLVSSPDESQDGMPSGKGGNARDSTATGKETFSSSKIKELTAAYRRGGRKAESVIDEIEKDPDYMLQTGNPEGEYDLASAIIGTGRQNKQGLYLLPYLQSGHVLLLLIILLCTFVYYPGFPLTELDDPVRSALKTGIGITYAVNAVLSVVAYKEAGKRQQPAAFWAFKTAMLGNLALNELKQNAPLQEEE